MAASLSPSAMDLTYNKRMKKIAIVIVVLQAFIMNAKAQMTEPKDMPQSSN